MLFDNKNFDNYNKSLADASDNFIRFNTLVKKYGNEIALNIMESKVWIGMTKAQILESKGKPHDSDKEEMKSKVRENYYYYSTADKKKYHTYTIENDELVKIVEK